MYRVIEVVHILRMHNYKMLTFEECRVRVSIHAYKHRDIYICTTTKLDCRIVVTS
jgi:hypothetical protein